MRLSASGRDCPVAGWSPSDRYQHTPVTEGAWCRRPWATLMIPSAEGQQCRESGLSVCHWPAAGPGQARSFVAMPHFGGLDRSGVGTRPLVSSTLVRQRNSRAGWRLIHSCPSYGRALWSAPPSSASSPPNAKRAISNGLLTHRTAPPLGVERVVARCAGLLVLRRRYLAALRLALPVSRRPEPNGSQQLIIGLWLLLQ